MRTRQFVMNTGMGYTVPASALVPAPPGPQFRGMGGFGGAWEDWCDQHYWTPENNTKCKDCNLVDFPLFGKKCTYFAPHTQTGKLERGLPQQTDLQRLGPPPGESTPLPDPVPPQDAPPPESWFEKNKMLVIAGGGALALGLVAFAMRGKRGGFRGFFGFGKAHRKRRKKSRR
jgi:hypothetical protein